MHHASNHYRVDSSQRQLCILALIGYDGSLPAILDSGNKILYLPQNLNERESFLFCPCFHGSHNTVSVLSASSEIPLTLG